MKPNPIVGSTKVSPYELKEVAFLPDLIWRVPAAR